ncbi:hypothetical protein [Arthrobacter rhombi]|uniref:hypothetical protein n=1 Tax=Arthrobacter rhombi TaxID=71253 RepID=UPI003F8E36A0
MLEAIQDSTKGENMAGSPVYGIGYHDGSRDGHQEGLEDGLAIGAVGVLVLAGAAYGVKKGVDKLKDIAAARHEKKLLAMEDPQAPQTDEENDDDDDDAAQNQ